MTKRLKQKNTRKLLTNKINLKTTKKIPKLKKEERK